ncbi:MAG: chromosome partitioning protein [Alphaproteobacteria bacterium]|jgi:chromosome partitioning protein
MAIGAEMGFAGVQGPRRKVVVIGNEKGGTGKSTTALHLAVATLYQGYRVGTLDLDSRQATLSRYLKNRERYAATAQSLPLPHSLRIDEPDGENIAEIEVSARRAIEAALAKLAACDVVFVDTPGSPTVLSRIGHEYANVLLTPVNDSLLDIDVLAEIDPVNRKIIAPCHYCRMAWEFGNQRIIDGLAPLDWVVIRNRLPHIHSRNREDIDQILTKLANRIGFRLAPGLGERVIFRELFLNGLTVLDLPTVAADRPLSATQQSAGQEISALLEALNVVPQNADALASGLN